jgi:hypothetical protein
MPTMNVTAYKGTSLETDSRIFQLDPNAKLSNVRSTLTSAGFLPPDNNSDTAFRFVATQSESTHLDDALIAKSTESLIPLAGVLGTANQLICTNYLARTKPDLIGISTDWFFNRYLGINISLNNSDPEGQKTNSQIKAFNPLMLTNVKPTSKNVVGIWDNVCVCVENSVVQLTFNSWGAAGFELYCAQDQGEAICDGGLYISGVPNDYRSTTIKRYKNKQQTIQIVGADSQGISGSGEILRFQKMTFKTRRMTSYKQNGQTFSSSQTPPVRTGPAGLSGIDAELADAAADFRNQRSLANAKGVTTIPGDSVKPGGAVQGPPSQQNWGAPISNIAVDDWSQALGEVVLYFFVFKSWEQANKVINGYNAPDPRLWN